MAEEYSIEAILSVVDQGFTQAMERAEKSTRGLESESKKSNRSIMDMAKGFMAGSLGAKAVTAGIDLIKSSIGGAISRYDTLNNASNVFTAMKFKTEDAEKAVNYFDKSLDGLPTALDQAIAGTQSFAGVTKDLDYSSKTWNALNNAVLAFGGSAEEVDSITHALSTSFAQGTVDGNAFKTMVKAGMGPALEEMASRAGMNMGEFKDALSSGEISAQEFGEMLQDVSKNGSENLESLETMARENTKGIGTALTNMSGRVARGVTSVIESIDNALATLNLPSIADMINMFSNSIVKALEGVGKGIEFLANIIQPAISAVTEMFSGNMLEMSESAQQFYEMVKGVWNGIIGFFSEVIMTSFETILEWWNENQQAFMETAKTVWEAVQATFDYFIGGIAGLFEAILSPVLEWFEEKQGGINEVVSTVWNAILTVISFVINEIVPIIAQGWTSIMNSTKAVWNAIFPIIESAMKLVLSVIDVILGIISGDWETVWNGIKGIAKNVWDLIVNIIDGALNAVGNIVSAGVSAVETAIKVAWNVIKGLTSVAWNAIVNVIMGILETIVSIVTVDFNSLKGIASSAWEAVKGAVSSGLEKIISTITGFGSKFFEAGKGIINQIADGIKGAIGAVTGAVKGVLKKARDLLPFSPPKDKTSPMAGIHKNGIITQVAKGIEDRKRAIQQAMSHTLASAQKVADDTSIDWDIGVPSDQVGSFSKMAQFSMDNNLNSSQAYEFTLVLGEQKFRAFVDDITRMQETQLELEQY